MKITSKIYKTIRHNFLRQNIGYTIIEVIAVFIWMSSVIILYFIFSRLISEIDFFDRHKFINIICTYFISDGLMYGFMYRNISNIAGDIESRKIENFFLIPTNLIQYLGFRNIQFASMIQIPIALIILLLWGEFSILSLLFWILSLAIGFLMTFNFWFIFSILPFWVHIGDKGSIMYEELIQMSMFPLKIFMSSKVFMPLLPIAFVASGGMEILSENKFWIVGVQVVLLVLLIGFRKVLWNMGVRRVRSG